MEDGIWILFNVWLVASIAVLNGLFTAADIALVKVKGSRIEQLTREGQTFAKFVEHVMLKLDIYLSACRLGKSLAAISLGWIGVPAISHLLVNPIVAKMGLPTIVIMVVSYAISFGIIIFIHIVLGELVPKSVASMRTEAVSLWLSGPLILFYRIMYPMIWCLNKSADTLLRWMGIQLVNEQQVGYTEEEILVMIKESQRSGHIDANELTLVENIFDFSDRLAREVMIPRTMIECLYIDLTFAENLEIVMQKRHTRFPVAAEDKDHMIGVVHATDIYNAALTQDAEKMDLQSLLRPIPYIPESMEISHVMRVMQKEKLQMVVVLDEYGGTEGLITLEDILEEIVGEIRDGSMPERPEVEVLTDRTSLDGRMLIEKVNELFKINMEDDEVDTIGGWIYSRIEGSPQVGKEVVCDDIVFQITEVEHLRIQRIHAYALPKGDGDELGEESSR